jgi:hypothetical protein
MARAGHTPVCLPAQILPAPILKQANHEKPPKGSKFGAFVKFREFLGSPSETDEKPDEIKSSYPDTTI